MQENNNKNNFIEILTNDNYKLLALFYENQVTILKEKYVPLKQEDMAKHLGLTSATIRTILKRLKENGLIEDFHKEKKYKLTEDGVKCVKVIKKLEKISVLK